MSHQNGGGGGSLIDFLLSICTALQATSKPPLSNCFNRVFHGFGQAKFADGGSILDSSQFTQLPQRPVKMMLNLKRSNLTQK